jgi:hypothetical protein
VEEQKLTRWKIIYSTGKSRITWSYGKYLVPFLVPPPSYYGSPNLVTQLCYQSSRQSPSTIFQPNFYSLFGQLLLPSSGGPFRLCGSVSFPMYFALRISVSYPECPAYPSCPSCPVCLACLAHTFSIRFFQLLYSVHIRQLEKLEMDT